MQRRSKDRESTILLVPLQHGGLLCEMNPIMIKAGTKQCDCLRRLPTTRQAHLAHGCFQERPSRRGPADVAHWLNARVVENWENNETLSLALPEKFKELSSRVTTILNKSSNRTVHADRFLESAASKFGSIMLRLMIRRVTESLWLDRPIVELPPNRHSDVHLSLDAEHIKSIQALEKQALAEAKDLYRKQLLSWRRGGCKRNVPALRPQQFLERAHQVQQLTVFPGLCELMCEHNLRLTENEMNGNSAYIYDTIDMNSLARFSPKIKWLGQMTTLQRQQLIDSFNTDTPITTPDGQMQTLSPDTIVSTFSLIGVGYTCVRAFRLVLMGPEWLHLEESQAMARIRRIDQRNAVTYTYRLICKNVDIEQSMVDRQAMRDQFNQMSMEIREHVEREHRRRLSVNACA
ncbi:uncharacterized protein EURHEDRAFT_553256 [Aspergillus ruber CBS 135680]|uniref:Uncharacterized protein n=1 Tax=Aspergillus ruber (strain CBS 135680) TaxID=1388766 RepID=A0A017RZ28_ASPRC|nr:uncharacterized protein EURHEDRAFT_553256 [Aspergillus ruber CBS 135680]EYE90018.1 hypothetical protein EURHEDRAFT_553256 [Aspergillus ruber CBS 135680]